jgi:Leucine-rich repeat (LRR) protein
MQSNYLTGTIPSEIGNMTELQTFNLMANRLGGFLPDLSSIKRLRNVVLVGNQLKGQIVDTFQNHNSLGTYAMMVRARRMLLNE